MRRSQTITLALVPLFAALATTGYSRPVCVDKNGMEVNESNCKDEEQRQQSQPGTAPFYYWYYVHGRLAA
jgi:hypothetical protein